MYSHEERLKAVKLYIKYEHSLAATIQKLGYPSPKALYNWHQEYCKNGELRDVSLRATKFTLKEKKIAVEHYFEYGRNYSRTVRMLGYPSRETLRQWCEELAPEARKIRRSALNYTQEQKKEAVIKLVRRNTSAKKIAEQTGVGRKTLYDWKSDLVGRDFPLTMPKQPIEQTVDTLNSEIDNLQKQVYQLRMEKEILERTSVLLKKEAGINPINLTNREKTILVDALRADFPLKTLFQQLKLVKSNYFYHRKQLALPDKYEEKRTLLTDIFQENDARYGYRRLHAELKNKGIVLSEKVVRRLMKEENLFVRVVPRKKYSSYAGEITQAAPNLLQRNFKAENPNMKWLTDITEFRIPAGKVYLSPIIDCFDGAAVSWTISTEPNAKLVNTMFDNALETLEVNEHPIVHSDRGAHYRWPGWIERIKTFGLTQSMSKKGCSPDNSACEGFFGRLKNEFFYGLSWKDISIDEFMERLDQYIHWYNEKRIKLSLGGISPLQYRRRLGLAA